MNLGQYNNYKAIIKDRVKQLQPSKPGLTLKRVAEKIPIQYTYLSKVLNDETAHLNEDHLFQVGQILEFFPHETDYLLLLRSYQTTENQARKQALFRQMEKAGRELGLSAKKRTGDEVKLQKEMAYLMDPYCSLVFVGLHIPQYKADPKQLCAPLGLHINRLKGILTILRDIGQIETGATPFQVLKLLNSRAHFDKNHPLTRMHQHLIGITCQNQMMKLEEEEKENIQITFTADDKARKKIQTELRKFLKQLEGEVTGSKDEHLYQMNLQLFQWV